MERKISDFLPECVKEDINEAFVLAIERFIPDSSQDQLEYAIDDFLNIWKQKTTAELKGVKPNIGHTWRCGICDFVVMSQSVNTWGYCPNCGTKIHWEE